MRDEIITIDEKGVVHRPKNDPNRFDPYEALDGIVAGVDRIFKLYPDLGEAGDVLFGQVRALRAYITGMEK